MKHFFKVLTKHFIEFTVELPSKFEVCHRCKGKGTHVNPSIDGNGLTYEDFQEDPDFMESYLKGHYDIRCEECGGERVIAILDEDRCKPRMIERYHRYLQEQADIKAENSKRLRDLERGIHY